MPRIHVFPACLIAGPQVPLIKGTMFEGGRAFDVDICIGAAKGEAAIQLVRDKVSDEPRP